MSAELIMSKWTGIESNQIAIQHNRSLDKLPVRNFKVEESEQVSLGISQIYPGLSTFGSNVWVVREKKTDNRFYIVRSWIYNVIFGEYVCGTCILSILGLFRVLVLKIRLLCLEVCSPLFWHYMCCNFRAWNTTKPQKSARFSKSCSHTHSHSHTISFENYAIAIFTYFARMNTQLVPEKCFVHSAIAQKMPFKNRTCLAIWLSSKHFKNLPLKTVDCGAWNENGAYERQRPNKPAKMNT